MASTLRSLDSILAARKAQVSQARSQDLIGLRRNGEVDSDDDDDEGAENTSNKPQAARTAGKGLDLGRAANQIAAREAGVRKRTLESLIEAELTVDQLKPLLRPLLLRFADESERCRDCAVQLFSRWQKGVDASEVGGALPFLLPVMVERLGSETGTEPSEEVRALLVTLMRDVLLKCRRLIQPYLRECGAIALGCCRDQHPEVIKGLCELLEVVAVDVLMPRVKLNGDGPKQVKPFSMKLLEAVLPHIRHRHAAVRTCVLRALEELLLCGAGQFVETLTGWRLKNNVPVAEFYGKGEARLNYLSDLTRDRSVVVRRQMVKTVSRWMSEMQAEDLYEQEVRIAPYLVSALCDEDAETAEMARKEIERLGVEHIELHLKDYKEKIEYGHADELAATRAITLPYPPPFQTRPTLGARERIMQHFRCLIHPICAELDQWTSIERLQSARLLEVLLVYVEGKVTEFAHQLLPALAKGVDEDNPELAVLVCKATRVFAQHSDVDEYMPLLVNGASDDSLNTLSRRVQHATLLTPLLEGMRPAAAAHALRTYVVPLLADEGLCGSQHTPLRLALRTLLESVLPLALSTAAQALADFAARASAAEAPPPPLAGGLLMAVLIYCASDVGLLPTTAVTKLGDGLEDVTTTYDDAAWAKAAALALQLGAPLLASLGACDLGPAGGGEGAAGAWVAWRAELVRRLEVDGSVYPEFAETALMLLERISPAAEAAASLRATRQSAPRFVQAAPVGKPAPAPASAPRRVLAISECDDFSDDDNDEEDVPIKKAAAAEKAAADKAAADKAAADKAAADKAAADKAAARKAAAEKAAADKAAKLKAAADEVAAEKAEALKAVADQRIAEKAALKAAAAKAAAEKAAAEKKAAEKKAAEKAAAEKEAVHQAKMKKVTIEQDSDDDEEEVPIKKLAAEPAKAELKKVAIVDEDSDDDDEEEVPIKKLAAEPAKAELKKVAIVDGDSDDDDEEEVPIKKLAAAEDIDDFVDELD